MRRAARSDLEELASRSGTKRVRVDSSPGLVFLDRFYDWVPLDALGHATQARAKASYDRFMNLGRLVLWEAVAPKLNDFETEERDVRRLIDQDPDRVGDFESVRQDALRGIDHQLKLLESLSTPSPTLHVVPDTSAVLDVPNLEAFDFGESDVEVVVTPVLLRELDGIKDDGRKDPQVRERARNVIRQLREYGRRGNMIHGVDGHQGVRIRAVAVEPRMDRSLPWLDPNVNDDRLIASVLEEMRQHLGSRVVLVSNDLNHLNKAAAAGIISVDPPSREP